MRLNRDAYYVGMLRLVASRSTCSRRSVGAIIVDSFGCVLATGYNGVPRGFPHCIDEPCQGVSDQPGNFDRCEAVHAEANAILQCSALERAHTIYVSVTPCFQCAKMILNTNIKRVIVAERYADPTGYDLLVRGGITVIERSE